MPADHFQDKHLASLTHDLGLQYPRRRQDWERRAQERLGCDTYQALQEYRRRTLAETTDAQVLDRLTEAHDFVGSDPQTTAVMLEGRLGYYDAVLPPIAEVLRQVPRATIVDLGCHAGLISLYLAQRFPDSKIIGVERSESLVSRAREYQAKIHVTNVEFIRSDYNDFIPQSPVDVVLCLQTLSSKLLPDSIPSESPEGYERGRHLSEVSSALSSAARTLVQALASMKRLAGAGGHVILHERLRGVSDALLVLFVAHQVGLKLLQITPIEWSCAGQADMVQADPLLILEAQDEPGDFEESPMLDYYFPCPRKIDFPAPAGDQCQKLTGPEAQSAFAARPGTRLEVTASARLQDGRRMHVYLGVADGTLAYVYLCTDRDSRELRVVDKKRMHGLFGPVVAELKKGQELDMISAMDPSPDILWKTLQARFGI